MLSYTFVECFVVEVSEYACLKLSHAINFLHNISSGNLSRNAHALCCLIK